MFQSVVASPVRSPTARKRGRLCSSLLLLPKGVVDKTDVVQHTRFAALRVGEFVQGLAGALGEAFGCTGVEVSGQEFDGQGQVADGWVGVVGGGG